MTSNAVAGWDRPAFTRVLPIGRTGPVAMRRVRNMKALSGILGVELTVFEFVIVLLAVGLALLSVRSAWLGLAHRTRRLPNPTTEGIR
ncbi:hypothetical protein [Nocardia sp. NPDC052112]|uniref:hypothetical protein n=1 Tax=Nocardia sp. NPDC052112 TaxID=3155646 RepID=UPI003414E6BB